MRYHYLIATTAIFSALALPAHAQQDKQKQQSQDLPPIVALTDWNYDEIYADGWSLEELLDADVNGAAEEIGDVENVLIDEKGKILSVIVEAGGFVDIGDTHVAVPWNEVNVAGDLDEITVPVTEENIEDYSIFGEWGYFTAPAEDTAHGVNEDLLTGPHVWKATDILDDYAVLTGGIGYGYVDDLIFTTDGMLHAVVVDPAVGYGPGPYAYPYYGYDYGWYPASPYYTLPYNEEDIAVIDTFDPEQMSDQVKMKNQQG